LSIEYSNLSRSRHRLKYFQTD